VGYKPEGDETVTTLLRVLLVEDSEDDANLTLRQLRRGGYDPKWERVDTPEAMTDSLNREPWDVILCDYKMPLFSGPAALKLVQEREIDIPFIIVSGGIGEDTAVAMMKAGAHDFVMKDKLARLGVAIEREMREARMRQEKKRAEEGLRIKDWAIESAINAIAISDLAGNLNYVNPAFLKLWGFSSPVEVLGKSAEGFWQIGEKAAEVIETLRILGGWGGELAALRKDGALFDVNVAASIIMDASGSPICMMASFVDITERKQAAEALRESEARYRALFQGTADGILIADLESRMFIYANPAVCRLLGYSEAELRTMGVADIHPKADLPAVVAEFEAQVRGDKTLAAGLPCLRKDGTIVYTDVNAGAMTIDGRVCNVGFFRDITERNKAEEKLRETLSDLRKALGGTIQVLSATTEKRDPYTAGHQRRVADLARAIGQEMGLAAEWVEGLRTAGSIHDIGKVSIPAEILSKPTRLTEIEYKLIQSHSQVGHDILRDIDFSWPLADIVLQHHERMNGSGYPQGLKGENILLEARILAVSDVVEAMASHRPYRPALGIAAALEEIEKNKGILYDPDVVSACLTLFREKGFTFNQGVAP
jgi:PAS domain S-box-containing protein